ncbi:MAG: hypothetical protein CO105_12725 [Comamonadaceae bacterium CG_4_9_14_3_um_filter_60_33]|nr:MAG: hypothetical protein CO105_12725 [Comamonadaceae bacterium CG_4_9_14_3_um_filter_60_33]
MGAIGVKPIRHKPSGNHKIIKLARGILTDNPVALWTSPYAPPMQHLFQTEALDALSWAVILGLGLLKFLAVTAEKALLRCMNITHF